jgi:uncharacterized protein (TIGR02646 family)
MVEIEHLSRPPAGLIALASASPVLDWTELRNPLKENVRHMLNQEQHGLCVYCERRLNMDHGRIDHIIAQTKDDSLKFVYSNLCHSCSGYYHNEGDSSGSQLSCDQAKGDSSLGSMEPRKDVNKKILFNTETGELHCSLDPTDPEYINVNYAINEVLGLNNIFLRNRRIDIWRSILNLIPMGLDPSLLIRRSDDFYWTMREFFTKAP